jgi:hypothetical protein
MSSTSTWRAGLDLNRRIAANYGADLSAFQKVVDLFAPAASVASRFLIWHAAMLSTDADPVFKLYLNPGLLGPEKSFGVIDKALQVLELPQARQFFADRSWPQSQIAYLSFDLISAAKGRVKVYVDHSDVDADYVDEYVRGSRDIQAGQAASWIRRLTAGRSMSTERPLQTCFAFRHGKTAPEVTVSVPLRFYVSDDAEALDRACVFLDGRNAEKLRRGVESMAERPLDTGRGLITYVSLRRENSVIRETVYLAPEMYGIATRRPESGGLAGVPRNSFVRELQPATTGNAAVVTFLDIKAEIARRQGLLSDHAFLRRIETSAGLEDVRAIAPRVGFFVLCFQDIQRLVHEYTTDPELKEIARVHRLEDHGHDKWYLEDLKELNTSIDVELLFSEDHAVIRELTYRQLADAIHSKDDRVRLALVLALESAGQLFFGKVIELLDRLGMSDRLQYFGHKHQDVEQSHEVFGMGGDDHLRGITVPADVLTEVLAVVDRTFGAIRELGNDLDAYLERIALPVMPLDGKLAAAT